MSSTDDEIRSGWMTTRDAELFGVLARGLTTDERRQVAEAITRADAEADQQVRRSKGHDPFAEQELDTTVGSVAPVRHLRGEQDLA
ncbi:MAG: hypothetical protein ACJ768_04035 [Gaiellaceae bacterium]